MPTPSETSERLPVIDGRQTQIQDCGGDGFIIFESGNSNAELYRDGVWRDDEGYGSDVWPTRESALAFLESLAGKAQPQPADAKSAAEQETATFLAENTNWTRGSCEQAAVFIGGIFSRHLTQQSSPADAVVDEAWLIRMGGKREEHPAKITFHREDALSIGLWDVGDGWKAMLLHGRDFASCIVRGIKTRTDLRRLAAALGVPLQEESR